MSAGASLLRFARPARGWPVATVIAAGCADFVPPAPPPDPEVTVAITAGRLCAGMQPWVDAEIERVQAETALELTHPLWLELGDAAVRAGCGEAPAGTMHRGCAVGTGGEVRVYARPEALGHELVHALRRQWELRTADFLEEGWAEAVAGSDVHPSIVEVDPRATDVDLHALFEAERDAFADPFNVAVATHVVRFIEASVGPEALAGFFVGGIDDDPEEARVRLEVQLGATWTTWATRWTAEAQPVSARGDACAGAEVDAGPDGVELSATVDCDAEGTFGIAGDEVRAWTRQCVRVTTPGPWRAELTAEGGSVTLRAVPGTCEADTEATAMASREIEPGAAVTTVLGACTYTATFGRLEDVPTAMTLVLRPEA